MQAQLVQMHSLNYHHHMELALNLAQTTTTPLQLWLSFVCNCEYCASQKLKVCCCTVLDCSVGILR